MSPEGRRERYLLATFEGTQCAVPLSCIDRMVRDPSVEPWDGRGVVRGFVMVEGWLVWVVAAAEIFPDFLDADSSVRAIGGFPAAFSESISGHWLMLFRQEEGLTRVGVLAEHVKGPLAFDRIANLRILRPGQSAARGTPDSL